MPLNEHAAYALAAWKRFSDTVTHDLTCAVTGAFALVAAADGDLAEAEVDRFMALLREQAADLAPLNLDEMEPLFRDLASALMSDPASGRRRALECIAAVGDQPAHRELVRAAAEIAMAADQRALPSEHAVLEEINDILASRGAGLTRGSLPPRAES